ncbi:MAG: tetratricopeptide repeat protein, partial [candidate division Zixibacteria bacterium]|nr:tetratricopeptide repeat protein [candidate division Zixibacteria bacterium]
EARIYLAKTKLKLGDEAEAMTLFERLFSESDDRSVKGDAAMSLGEYYFENKDYEKSRSFFQSIIDSLGEGNDKLLSQNYIADGYFTRFKYKDALNNYLKILELEPGVDEKYRAIFRAGECSYFLNDITQGMDYFSELAENEDYFDSLGQIKLQLALGHELDGDILLAETIYHEVALETGNNAEGAAANYNLGLIYQFDYEDYTSAKGFYDRAKSTKAEESIYKDALQRSSDIGKLEQFLKRNVLDTSSTRAQIDSAASTQYLLAELYFFQLDKPDSAYQEFEYIIKNFPESYLAPKALIAMA